MQFVYVLYSLKDHRLYKGCTSDIGKRMQRHNKGKNPSTKHRVPFVLIHVEQFEDKSRAFEREKYLKTSEGGRKLKAYLVENGILGIDNELHITRRSS